MYCQEMRFGNFQTLRKYDNFKQQIFSKYKHEHKQRYRKSKIKPNRLSDEFKPVSHPFIKKSVAFCAIAASLLYLNHKLHLLERVNKSVGLKYLCSPYLVYATTILQSEISRQLWGSNPTKALQDKSGFIANAMLMDLLATDLEICKMKRPTKTISQNTNSDWAIGAFRGGVSESVIKISEDGEVVQQTKNCKVKVGHLCLFGSRTEKVLQKERIHAWYQSVEKQENWDAYCSNINKINKYTLGGEEYSEVLGECIREAKKLSSKMRGQCSRRARRIQKVNGNPTRCIFC